MAETSQVLKQQLKPELTYKTIREEILDQKRCQFQLLSLAVTVTTAVLAYGTAITAAPLVYLAPLVMNVVAVVIIFDKAFSIQRKVGYLQMMEEKLDDYAWMWETQLDEFRKKKPEKAGVREDPSRKHSYVTTVGFMFVVLNAICVFLFLATPSAWKWHVKNLPWLSLGSSGIVLAMFLYSAIAFLKKRATLIRGRYSGPQIYKTWEEVLRNWKVNEKGRKVALDS